MWSKIQNGGWQQFLKKDLHYNYFVHTELESKVSFLNFKIKFVVTENFPFNGESAVATHKI